jgi:hypothetical protein
MYFFYFLGYFNLYKKMKMVELLNILHLQQDVHEFIINSLNMLHYNQKNCHNLFMICYNKVQTLWWFLCYYFEQTLKYWWSPQYLYEQRWQHLIKRMGILVVKEMMARLFALAIPRVMKCSVLINNLTSLMLHHYKFF